MIAKKKTLSSAIILGFLWGWAVLWASGQILTQNLSQDRLGFSEKKEAPVTFLFPSQVKLAAGKASAVALHFRVAEGLHINSHTPKDEFLIPTRLTLAEGEGVHLLSVDYPAGTEYALPVDPGNKLSVYAEEFVLVAHLVATAGHHPIKAQLRFQACDQNACMPPKTITTTIDVIAE